MSLQKKARGIDCNVWIATRNDWPSTGPVNSTWEWYFAVVSNKWDWCFDIVGKL